MLKNQINYLLYQERINRNINAKDAASSLKINRLHLYLIEHGYMRVSEKLEERFIEYYSLPNDFFTINSRHIRSIDKEEETKENKIGKIVKNKKVIYVGSVLILGFVFLIVFGFYNLNYKYNHVEDLWSENYKTLRTNLPNVEGTIKDTDTLNGDDFYKLKKTSESSGIKIVTELAVYEKNFNSTINHINAEFHYMDGALTNRKIDYYIGSASNNYYLSYSSNILCTEIGLEGSYYINCYTNAYKTKDGSEYVVSPFTCTVDKQTYSANEDSVVYKFVQNEINKTIPNVLLSFKTEILDEHDLGYTEPNDFLTDTLNVSAICSSKFKLGLFFIIFSFVLLPIVAFFVSTSLILNIKTNKKNKEKIIKNNKNIESIYTPIIAFREPKNDIKFMPFIPECFLRGLAVIFMIVYAISLNLSINYIIHGGIFDTDSFVRQFQKYTGNLLVSCLLLMFFLKLDVNHKKTQKELLINICIYFFGGLIYYLCEVLIYLILIREGNIVSALIQVFVNVIPGNILWCLLMYYLIYFFLFITPKKLENNKNIIWYRLVSIVPTLFLIFSLFYKEYLEKIITHPYYFSFLFYTKGSLMTCFAILYLYFLYFYNKWIDKNYGKENAEIYHNSSRYNMIKNCIASSIILLLFFIDLMFKFYYPNNNLKLGNNWTIVFLIPFILFYRTHIGKRNKLVDNILQYSYLAFFIGSYAGAVIQVISLFDVKQIIEMFIK